MEERKALATYHFLGALFFWFPLLGLIAAFVFHSRKKIPTQAEDEHFRALVNFILTLMIAYFAIAIFFPRSVAFVLISMINLLALMLMAYNGWEALKKGKEPAYGVSISLIRPTRKAFVSVEEMMYREKHGEGPGSDVKDVTPNKKKN